MPPGPGDAQALPGLRLGAWELQRKIGQGGVGQVWLARRADGLYEGQAAIKLLHVDGDAGAVDNRFARERAALGRLSHTGIAALLDAGVQSSLAYLVLEFVDGLPLSDHARRHGATVAARVALLLRVAEAVEHAHARLVVHRDLKPANVMVTADGTPKLLDFGLSAQHDAMPQGANTDPARTGLTPGYAAPEQICDDDTGTSVDVFALGVMLFELLTGSLPFGRHGLSRAGLEHAVLHRRPHRVAALLKTAPDAAGPGRPRDARRARGDLEAIAVKALQKAPGERYVGVHAFIEDLRRWQQQRPVAARRNDGWRHHALLWLRRNLLLAGLATLVLLTLAGGLALSTWQWRAAEASRQRSENVTNFLSELLSHDDPGRAGRTPTVLELLDESRSRVDTEFADDPGTRQRLLEVMSRTYMALNRFDHALPLGEQWLALARQQHRDDEAPVLQARLSLGQVQQIIGNHEAAIALLEPIAAALARRFGPDSEEVRQQQFILAADYMHSQRLADAERALERVRVLTDKLHPGDEYEYADYMVNLSVLRQRQGRIPEGLAVIRQTRPIWQSTNPRLGLQLLVLRRAEVSMMGLTAEFDGLDERVGPLVADMRSALGPGNDLGLSAQTTYALSLQLQGRHADEVRTRQALLASASDDGLPAQSLVPFRAELLQALARIGRPDHAAILSQVSAAAALPAGTRRARSLLALAEAALAAGDTAAAAGAVARLREQPLPAMFGAANGPYAKVEGRLARAQGDLARSRQWLQQRAAGAQSQRNAGAVQTWAACLDAALTALLQGDTEATSQLLAQARAERPARLPDGHPLDLVTRWLAARLEAGRDDAPAVRTTWAALSAARGPGAAVPTLGSLGGLLP
jgi:serine/threonine-protein kinase